MDFLVLLCIILSPIVLFAISTLIVNRYNFQLGWTLPFPVILGFFFMYFLDHSAGVSGGPAAIAAFISLLLLIQIAGMFVLSFVLFIEQSNKAFQLTLIAILAGASLGMIYDRIFIEPHEIGEKGNSSIQAQYPDWRILDN
ncbi:hypothetical protein HON52_03445 [Candidatus Uhrbacteria bacterium]|jgi:lipoprotein signal peptidase|nr:hypothetical protein [Candidatus Uhrbacteria bacterium]